MMMVPRKNGFNIFDEVFNDPFFTKKENKINNSINDYQKIDKYIEEDKN